MQNNLKNPANKNKGSDAWRIIVGGFGAAIAIICGIFSVVMLRSALSPWWIPVAVMIPFTLLLALPLRSVTKWITGSSRVWLNILCHMFLAYPILLFALLLTNHLCTVGETRNMTAVIDSRNTETRYRSRRVTRRVYRSTPYKAYVVKTTLENGEHRKFDLSFKTYKAVRKGDTLDIPVSTGIFRIVTLDVSDIKPRHPRTSDDHKTKFFGTSGRPKPRHSAEDVARRHRERIDSIYRKYKH